MFKYNIRFLYGSFNIPTVNFYPIVIFKQADKVSHIKGLLPVDDVNDKLFP